MKQIWFASFLAAALVALLVIAGCGTSQQTTTTTTITTTSSITTTTHGVTSYYGSQSPGDWWSWTLGDSTFIGTNESASYTYAGTYTNLPTGFKKAVISATTDPGLTTPATAYVLEYPNVAMLVKPAGDDDNVIVCAAKATSTPSAGFYNYVNLPYIGWEETTYAAYGTVEVVNGSGGKFDFLNVSHNMAGATIYSSRETDFVFADGKLSKAGSSLQVFLTPSGAFMGDSGPGEGGFCGGKKETLTMADVATREYNGILFDYDVTTGIGTSTPVGGEPHPTVANAIRGYAYSNVETGTIDPTSDSTLQITSQDSDGIFHGTLTTPVYTYTMHAVITRVAGKVLFFSIGTAPGNDSPIVFMVIEK